MRTLLLSKCFLQRWGEGGEEFENNDGDALNAVLEVSHFQGFYHLYETLKTAGRKSTLKAVMEVFLIFSRLPSPS